MSTGYKIGEQNNPYYLTFQVVDWVDIFTRVSYKELIVDSFEYCRKEKNLILYAYVIMTNHIHLIAEARPGNTLSNIIRDFKKWTSVKLLEQIKQPGESRSDWMLKRFEFAAGRHEEKPYYQLWTHENHPMELYSYKFIKQKLDYIHNNPVKAGIVSKPEDYIYSSARNYAELPSRLRIDPIW